MNRGEGVGKQFFGVLVKILHASAAAPKSASVSWTEVRIIVRLLGAGNKEQSPVDNLML